MSELYLQLFHRIDAFVQYKRHLVDVSNQLEFCQRGSSGNDYIMVNMAHMSCIVGGGGGGEEREREREREREGEKFEASGPQLVLIIKLHETFDC